MRRTELFKSAPKVKVSKLSKLPRSKRPRSNRIYELTRERKWKYADVANRVRQLAATRGDGERAKVHGLTINRLATGALTLTQEWMNILGEAFGVPATEIIAPPAAQNLRRVAVTLAFQAGMWKRTADLPEAEQYATMIKDDEALRGLTLYAGEIRGEDSNARYSAGSIAIVSKVEQKPGEIIEGRRYHVRVTRDDGAIEDTIKILAVSADQYWLKPESNAPEHQEWLPLAGRPGLKVDLVGRVRGVFFRED